MSKQMYGKEFCSKRQFLKWLEENEDKIEWEDGVEFSWYYKDEDNDRGTKFVIVIDKMIDKR